MTVWIVAAVLVVLAVILVAKLLPREKREFVKSKRITEVRHEAGGGAGDSDDVDGVQTIDLGLRNRIARILADGGKIHAIKELREATGWGLKDSKDFVDALERDGVGSELAAHSPGFESLTPATGDVDLDDLDHNALESVMREIRQGRKINAIKLMREMTGLGLKESKDLVEDIEQQGLHR